MTWVAISSRTWPMNLAKKRNTAQSASRDRAVTSLSYRGTNVCMQVQHARAKMQHRVRNYAGNMQAIDVPTRTLFSLLRRRNFLFRRGSRRGL